VEENYFLDLRPSKKLLFLIIADMILGIVFSSFGMMGFKVIPLRQTLIINSYVSVFSFLINDFIKFFLFKKWPLNYSSKNKIVS